MLFGKARLNKLRTSLPELFILVFDEKPAQSVSTPCLTLEREFNVLRITGTLSSSGFQVEVIDRFHIGILDVFS